MQCVRGQVVRALELAGGVRSQLRLGNQKGLLR